VSRQIRLVVNPSAGKGRALELLPHVAGTLRDGGANLEILLSRDFAEAQSMARRAIDDDVDVLAVMGGDGMMHLGVNTAATAHQFGGSRTALGLIPAGTGNDLCRGVGLDPHDAVAAAAVIAAGYTRALDLAQVGDTYVAAVLATGFDALVNRRANQMSWPRGSSRYAVATIAELRVFSPLRYRLTLDGEVREQQAMLVAVGNTSSYGGGMLICPRADPYDGLLDVTIIHPVGRLKLLRLLPEMYSGSFVRDPCVEQLRVREVTVEGLGLVGFGDGEMIAAAPLKVSCVPRALPVFTPEGRSRARMPVDGAR
jgi:diacylglycerol kinase (ATP)